MFDTLKIKAALSVFDGASPEAVVAALEAAGAERRTRLRLALAMPRWTEARPADAPPASRDALAQLNRDAEDLAPMIAWHVVNLGDALGWLLRRTRDSVRDGVTPREQVPLVTEALASAIRRAIDAAGGALEEVGRRAPRWIEGAHEHARPWFDGVDGGAPYSDAPSAGPFALQLERSRPRRPATVADTVFRSARDREVPGLEDNAHASTREGRIGSPAPPIGGATAPPIEHPHGPGATSPVDDAGGAHGTR